jgi:hypothetical protein
MSYNSQTAPSCAWYRRSLPRNDSHVKQAVPWVLSVPTGGVVLTGGPLADTFTGNVQNYLRVRDPLDMLHFFAQRFGSQQPVGDCYGWDEWIKGSATGNYLMGAGGALRWLEDAELRARVESVIAGIAQYADPTTGWLWAFDEKDIGSDNLPDYCASWVTRGLLDAHAAGVPGALDLARASISLFNNHSALPFFLPQNGGPHPVLPYPSGFNNVTSGGYGQATGHMIYIQWQGLPKHTLLALTEAGTQADVDIAEELYVEQWWLEALLAKDSFHGIWHKQFYSHNYENVFFESLVDLYVLTGNATYLQASLNAWEMLRGGWILPGGSFALNEGSYYPPGSYYIGFHGTHVASKHSHAPPSAGGAEEDPFYHAPCMPGPGEGEGEGEGEEGHHHISPLQALRAPAMAVEVPSPAGGPNPNDSDPPTGELCGSVFWTKLNQRFHRLYPDNETFVGEMERSILNIGVAALGWPGSGGQGPNGTGIRYFANMDYKKQYPSMHASCCEGQGTRLYGSLPEYVYTLAGGDGSAAAPASGLYVDLYADSAIAFAAGQGGGGGGGGGGAAPVAAVLTQDTAWPYGTGVALTLTLPAEAPLDLALRMPAWVAAASVPVAVNGTPWPQPGTPGSYLHLSRTWPAGNTSITLQLPMAFQAVRYSGSSQLPPYQRWAYLLGPVLLAVQGPWNSTLGALVMPQPGGAPLDPAAPGAWLAPVGGAGSNPLHFAVAGAPGWSAKPYFEVQAADEIFSVFPHF